MRPPAGSLLVRGIGLLVTNRAELGEGPLGVLRDVDLVIEAGAVVLGWPWRWRAGGRLGPRRRRSLRDPRLRRLAHPPRLRR